MTLTISRRSLVRVALFVAAAVIATAVALGVPQLSPAARPTTASALTPAALNSYLTVRGQKQGAIRGSVLQKGREGQILVSSFSWEIKAPVDAASGLATGKRQHKPFTFTKEVDASTPHLFTALTTNENLPEMTFKLWRPSPGGVEQQYLTYKFTNARIVDIATDMASTLDPSSTKLPVLERVSLVYQKVEMTWVDGGVTFADDWSASPA